MGYIKIAFHTKQIVIRACIHSIYHQNKNKNKQYFRKTSKHKCVVVVAFIKRKLSLENHDTTFAAPTLIRKTSKRFK